MYDLLVKNGRLIDGTGNLWFQADVGVAGERIAEIGPLPSDAAKETIDACGLCVAPGFVDVHSHSELAVLQDPRLEPKVMQGITTEVTGNCGLSCAPVDPSNRQAVKDAMSGIIGGDEIEWDWTSVASFLSRLSPAAVNAAYLLPHALVRIQVMGFEQREASGSELSQMREVVAQGMAEGAIGLSSGLTFSPANAATTGELIELCKVVARHNGIYATHMRDYLHDIDSGVREVVEICRSAEVPGHIAHYAAVGLNRGKARHLLDLIEQARAEGADLSFDAYPYIAGSTSLKEILPIWMQDGGTDALKRRLADPEVRAKLERLVGAPADVPWDAVVIVDFDSPELKQHAMKSVAQIAQELSKSCVDTACDLLLADDLSPRVVVFIGSEEDVQTIMGHPVHMFSTDGLLFGDHVHPRTYGTYPRILGRYVRDLGNLTLPEAIRKMTSYPAARFGLRDRGLLRPGYFADLCLFDPDTVIDRATFQASRQFPEGIRHVIVNGTVVVDGGRHTGELPGRVIEGRD